MASVTMHIYKEARAFFLRPERERKSLLRPQLPPLFHPSIHPITMIDPIPKPTTPQPTLRGVIPVYYLLCNILCVNTLSRRAAMLVAISVCIRFTPQFLFPWLSAYSALSRAGSRQRRHESSLMRRTVVLSVLGIGT